MLIDFRVANYGPFKNEAVLSMQRMKGNEHLENLFHADAIDSDLLNSIAIFGANASGKTYIFKAINTLGYLVAMPAPANSKIIHYNPFRLSSDTKNSPTKLRIRYIESDILYDYCVSYDREHIVKESLSYYPKKQKVKVFSRDDSSVDPSKDYIPNIETNKNIVGLSKIKNMVNTQSTFLSLAAQMNNPICINAHRWIVEHLVPAPIDTNVALDYLIQNMNSNPKHKKYILNALRIADLGITDISGTREQKNLDELTQLPPFIRESMSKSGIKSMNNGVILTEHKVNVPGLDETDMTFPFGLESAGTIQFMGLLTPMLGALIHGGVLIIDEFGSGLHDDICKWIIRLFNDPKNNPHHAQLLINTHDQMLMDSELFRRDQIYFTDKDSKTGSSDLYSLADYTDIRKGTSIQKSYEFGRFGAKPFISNDDVIE